MTTTIGAGTYRLTERGLQLEVAEDLELSEGRIFYLCGRNGVGKTSFVEKVLIPALQRDEKPYLYLGQDIGLQLYTLRASLAVAGHGLYDVDNGRLITLWINEGRGATAFILDEFDKYYPDCRFVFEPSKAFIKTYIMVSHADVLRLQLPDDAFERHLLTFRCIGQEEGLRRVRVERAKL